MFGDSDSSDTQAAATNPQRGGKRSGLSCLDDDLSPQETETINPSRLFHQKQETSFTYLAEDITYFVCTLLANVLFHFNIQ